MTETLREQDFESCFADEPLPGDPRDDLSRAQSWRRRRRTRTASLVVATVVVLVTVVGLSTLRTRPLVGVPEGQPTTAPGVKPTMPAGPAPSAQDRSFLLPPDSPQRIWYSRGTYSDPLPVSAGKIALVSKEKAIATIGASNPASKPRATLRLLTGDGESGLRGSEPYWVLTWPKTSPPHPSGPYIPDPVKRRQQYEQQRRMLANSVCLTVTFVNARTGHPINGIWQLCARR